MKNLIYLFSIFVSLNSFANNPIPEPIAFTGCGTAISEATFKSLLSTLEKHDFDEVKKAEAEKMLQTNCFTSAQIKQITLLFSFEEDKLDFAKKAYTHVSDPANYQIVIDTLDFETSKSELRKIMQ